MNWNGIVLFIFAAIGFTKVSIFVHPIYQMHRLGFFLFSFLYVITCTAQDSSRHWEGFGIETDFFEGKVIKHTPKFHLPLPNLTTGVDINFQWKTYGKKEWHQRRRYPVIGVGFAYTNYGIDSVYGHLFSLYPNLTIPLITGRKLEWTLRIGDGISYTTRDFSRLHPFDTANNAIGSHINDYGSFMMDLRYHVNNHWDVQLGANFAHYSDASYHQPNLGINLYGTHIGIKYFPVSSSPKRIVRDLKPLKNRWLFQFRLTMAFDGSYAPQGPIYPIYLATGYVSKRWISKNKFFAGLDYSYHTNIYSFLRNNEGMVPYGTEREHSYKSAIFAGNEFLLGRVGVVLQVGYYIHQAFQVEGKIYEKIGGNLYLVQREHGVIKEFFLCAFLKTHLSVAELSEYGFGMGF